jgi:hypothetical protein
MFNIWKHAWRHEDPPGTENEASVNVETQSNATGDRPFAGSASVPPSVSVIPQSESSRTQPFKQSSSFPTSKKHARATPPLNDTVDTSDSRPTKKAKKETHADAEKKDSLANYLPEVPGNSPVKSLVVSQEKSPIVSHSYLDEISERAQRVNSKVWLVVMHSH